jgi:uncharacterized protein (DUF2141 family)
MFARLMRSSKLAVGIGFAAVLCAALPSRSIAQAAGNASITVKVTGIRGTQGSILLALRSGPGKIVQGQRAEIDTKTMTAQAVFAGIAPGTYDVAVLHDENGNGKLDFNDVGMPIEGYGHTNNPEKRPGEPSFDETKFTLGSANGTFEVKLVYWP